MLYDFLFEHQAGNLGLSPLSTLASMGGNLLDSPKFEPVGSASLCEKTIRGVKCAIAFTASLRRGYLCCGGTLRLGETGT